MLAYLFPGQGSQECGMGKGLFSRYPELVHQADDILGYSIEKLCLEDPNKHLNITLYTQPAIFVVNALHYLDKLDRTNLKPDYVAGHSLGEYNALWAANVFDFPTGLSLVKKRAELMHECVGGGMAAVMGLSSEKIKSTLQQHQLNNLSIANYNSYTQCVISGPSEDMTRAQPIFQKISDSVFIPLKVSGAFHSPHMSHAQEKFNSYLDNHTFHAPTMPVLANVDAKPYHPAITKNNLAAQIASPVYWLNIMSNLLLHKDITMEEVGHGKILTGLVNRIRSSL